MYKFRLAFAAVAAIFPLAAMAQLWTDNFDSYGTGVQLHGVGGWKGWQNDITFGALTSGAQFQSSPNSVDIAGAADLVQEYTVTGGLWTYSGSMFVPTAHTGQSYMILMSNYNDALANAHWSVQMYVDSGVNTVSEFSPNGGTPTPVTLVKGSWVPFHVEIDLVADTKRVIYNGQQILASRWRDVAGGTSGATLTLQCVDLYANATTSVFYDNLSLGHRVQFTNATTGPGSTVAPSVATNAYSYSPYDVRWNIRPGAVLVATADPVRATLEFFLPSPTVTTMSVVVESKATVGGIRQIVQIKSGTSTAYTNLETFTGLPFGSAADRTVSLAVATPNNHIDATGNKVVVQLLAKNTTAVLVYPWQYQVDACYLEISP